MAFDVAAARKAGYSEAEIASYLASQKKFDLSGAKEAGYSDAEIIGHLAGPGPAPTPKGRPAPSPKSSVADIDLTADYLPGRRVTKTEGVDYRKSFAAQGTGGPKREPYRAPRAPLPESLKAKYKSDQAGVIARGALRAAGPTVAGIAGAEAGAAALAPAAPVTFGVAPFVGGLLGGIGGGYLGYKAQKSVMDMLPDKVEATLGQNEAQHRQDVAAHPNTAFIAENLPGYLTGRPGKLTDTILGGVLGGGLEAGQEFMNTGKVDPVRAAEATFFGATQSKGNKLSRSVVGKPDTALEAELRATRPGVEEALRRKYDINALGGASAAPIDILPEVTIERLGSTARKNSPNADMRLRGEVATRVGDAPAAGKRIVGKVAPTDTRTAQEVAREAESGVRAAQESVRPDVPIGDASTQIAERLVGDREAQRKAAGDLFNEARAKGVAVLGRSDGPDLSEEAGWYQIPADEHARAAQSDEPLPEGGWRNAKTGETLSAQDFADLKTKQNPRVALAGELRDSITDYALNPNAIPGTLKVLGNLDKLEQLDTSNLYAMRKDLGGVERAFPGTPDAAAAGIARRRLDDLMRKYDEDNLFTGDPDVVAANSAAIRNWRDFRQAFDDDTLIGKLSAQEWRGTGRAPVNDPQTASRLILGPMTDAGNRVRDLSALRGYLGADSPEWAALRQEAVEKAAGKVSNSADYIKRLEDWRKANPRMAELLLGQSGDQTLQAAASGVAEGQARLGAQETGAAFLRQDPKDFAASVRDMGSAARRDAIVTARQTIRDALKTPDETLGVLGRIATNADAQANLRALLPAREADDLIRNATTAVDRVRRAGHALKGSEASNEAESIATDLVRVGGAAHGTVGRAIANTAADLLKGKGSPAKRRREADDLAADLLNPDKTASTLEFMRRVYGENAAQRLLGVMRQGAAEHLDKAVKLGRLPGVYVAGEDTAPEEKKAAPATPAEERDMTLLKNWTDKELEDTLKQLEGQASVAEDDNEPVTFNPMAYKPIAKADLVKRVVHTESRGNPDAVSPKGARGVMQIMPSTGVSPGFGVAPLRDGSTSENKRMGEEYLNRMIDRYGSQSLGLMAYNWGPGNVDQWLKNGMKGRVPRETRKYVAGILGGQQVSD